MKRSIFRISLLLLFCVEFVSAQSINTEFGKNRVQYHDDFNDWWMYETENFITYWYGKSKNIGIPAMQMAEADHDQIQKVLEHRMNDKIELIVYTDLTDLNQSNIGTEETFATKGGQTRIVGNKMFIYFDGDHNHMRQKIKEGIASVYFNNMLFGSTLQEIVQNAVLLNLPEWYKQGVVSYAASPWDQKIEGSLRDIWNQSPRWHKFDKMIQQYPRQAGHAFWYYVEQNYGRSAISNIIYLTKINRGVNNSFEYILNKDLKEIKVEWQEFYSEYFGNEKNAFDPSTEASKIKLRNNKQQRITTMKSSPDGRYIVYTYNQIGKYRIALFDTKSKQSKVIFKRGYNNHFQETDLNYPLVAWHPNSQELTYIYEKKDVIHLTKYFLETEEKIDQTIPTAIQRVYSFDYVNDMEYIFAANTDGFGDLHYYNSRNRNHGNISQDFFDELDAQFVSLNGTNGTIFASNRNIDSLVKMTYDTILPLGHFDLYFLPQGAYTAIRLTNTPHVSERKPTVLPDGSIIFTSDHLGVNNLFVKNNGAQDFYPITNLDRDIISYTVNDDDLYITMSKNNKFVSFKNKFKLDSKAATQTKSVVTNVLTDITVPILEVKQEFWSEDIMFVTEYDDPADHKSLASSTKSIDQPTTIKISNASINNTLNTKITNSIEPYNFSRPVAAKKRFGFTNIVTKLDNDILFEGLESYTGDRQEVLNAPLGILFRATTKDIFEDYTIDAGIRIPTTFNGSETFLVFDKRNRRIDERMALYRKTTKYDTSDPNANIASRSQKTSLLGMYQLKYPFHTYSAIRATTSMRFDRFHVLSTENISFESPISTEKRLSLKLEYVYDNTFDAALNIKHGFRAKIFNESINQFDINLIDGVKFSLSDGFTNILGYDARYYLPILKKSLLAFRSAAATSFGNKKMLYYLGGMENNIFRRFEDNIPIPSTENFAYKANAYQLRGFQSNIRNGSTFFVVNTEVRLPIFQYILGPNKGSSILRNLQLTSFFDAGVAFYGTSPFDKRNILNKVTIESPPLITLDIEYFRDPMVMGFGYGLRTQLFGYFVKLDYGYGIETRKVQEPKLYISIGTDF